MLASPCSTHSLRIALLADFPVHTLPGFEGRPHGHHATWLPPLADELKGHATDFDLHWITCTKEVTEPLTLRARNQTFHLLPRRKLSFEMLTAFRRERRLISRLLQQLNPDIVHGWGTEQGYAYAATDFPGSSLISLQGILQAYCKAAAMPWLTRLQAIHEARVLKRARHLTVESPWGETQLRNLAPQAEIHRLEYAADPACFEIQVSTETQDLSAETRAERREQREGDTLEPITSPPKLSSLASPSSRLPASSSSLASRVSSLPASSSSLASRVSSLPASSSSLASRVSSLPAPTPLALFVGSLSLLKGVDTLLAAFSDPRLRHVELIVLGAGSPACTNRTLPPNIHLLGHRPTAEVRDWMSKAWCLVHPTLADTSPNCVKEARVIGLPVVTTPNGGQTQYVEHGKSGFIHPAGDIEGLIKGVLTVTKDKETSLQMGAHGQAECRAALNPATTARNLLSIYRTLLG